MSLGFVLLVHENLDRVAEFAAHLAQEGCPVALHVDKRVPKSAVLALAAKLNTQKNIILTRRFKCEWGKFSIVAASQHAAEELLVRFSDVERVFLLSGSCLPARPVRQLKRFLARRPGVDFIESFSVEDSFWVKDGLNRERFELYFPFSWKRNRWLFDRFVSLQRRLKISRRPPAQLPLYIGSQWWCLTRRTLTAILNDPQRPQIDRFFARSWIPDESYFQSCARRHADIIESQSLTFAMFDSQGKPFTLYDDHLEQIRRSDVFFARKIWSGANKLYATLLDPERNEPPASAQQTQSLRESFERANIHRCESGEGLFNQGRYPNPQSLRSGLSPEPYIVLIGLQSLIPDIRDWLSVHSHAQIHGNIFSKEDASFLDPGATIEGNISKNIKIRDANPAGYLANVMRELRSDHQKPFTFFYDLHDTAEIIPTLIRDPNAQILMIKSSWLLHLSQQNKAWPQLLPLARDLQHNEMSILNAMMQIDRRATITSIKLEDAISEPARVNRALTHILPLADRRHITHTLKLSDVSHLDHLSRKLRNKGFKIDFGTTAPLDGQDHEIAANDKPYIVKTKA